MKVPVLFLSVALMSSVAYGKDIFKDKELRSIRISGIHDGKAVLRVDTGGKEEIMVGDRIGKERGKVIEIGKNYITVESGKTRTRIPGPFAARGGLQGK